MSAKEKSDLPEVAEKRANKAASAAAELVERRGGAKENAELQSTVRTQSREAVSQAQARIREAVNRNRQDKVTALLHHLTIDVLRASFFGLKKSAAPGVDEMTWTEYAEGLEENLSDLHSRVQTGAYRALPSRRTYIPKADGRQRPLGIAALEDKIVQAAVVAILTPIYEAEFLGFSYGFRPKRSQHQALDALAFGIGRRRINWVLDCDVQSFFDKVSQSWLIRFIEHRIGDRRIIRLIAKWLTAGVLEGGHLIVTEEGTPQGAVISPLLANIYLHYVYDLWAHQWRQRCATGDVIVVRYADDTIVGFEHQHEAERFLADLKARLARTLRAHPSSRQDAAHRVWPIRNCESTCSGSRQAGVVRFPRVHAFLRHPSERLGLRAREETGGQANACQASRDQGAANGHTARRDRKAGPLAQPGSARLDGLLCCADERLSDLSVPASHDRTLARRSDASKPKTSTNVDENEEDR
jgi:RNA-directed DNA polymerase